MAVNTLTRPDLAPPPARRRLRQDFRGDIEGLRAVAVVLVVAFHAEVEIVGGGFVGVDVFFVLSGFLITGLLVDEVARTGSIAIGDFYARRVRRLLPMATLVLVATAAASLVLVPPVDRSGVAGDVVGAALWSANWTFAAESTQYMADADKSPVLHFWSLAVEEQFYVVWPLVILVLVGRSGLALRAWPVVVRRLAFALALVIAGSVLLSHVHTDTGSPFAYFGLHTRAWELGVGAALALARPLLPLMSRGVARGAALLGASMVLGAALLMDERTPFPGSAAAVPVLGTALLLAAGARLPDGVVTRALSRPAPRYIGRISYAWYLWHWPVLVLAAARWGVAGTDVDGEATGTHTPWPVVLAAVALSLALAAASHHVVEQPLRQAGFLRRSTRRSLLAGVVLVASSLGAAALLQSSAAATVSHGPVGLPPPETPAPLEGDTSAGEMREPRPPKVDPAAPREPNTPEEARADRPRLGRCYAGFDPTTVPPAQDCRVGPARGGERTIALIGDSHAAAWYPAFRRAAEEHGWTLYFFGKSSCAVVDVEVRRGNDDAPYENCSRWRENLLDRVEGIKGLDAVVVGRWMAYRGSTVMPDGSASSPATVGPVWAAGAERTFDRLRRATDRIIVLKDVPWPRGDVPSCLSEHRDEVQECAFSRSRRSDLDAVLVEAETSAAPRGTVRVVGMTDVICPGATCQVVSPTGQVKFRDQHHLTSGYSATLWRELAERVDEALG